MMRRRDARLALIIVLLATTGFTYQLALPGRKISFPADHSSHPDFKTEWWYYTGHLAAEGGKRYGYQVTFFRYGLRDRQNELKVAPLFTELYMAHFALSDIAGKKFFFRERINRGSASKAGERGNAGKADVYRNAGRAHVHGTNNKAGAATDRFLVWNEDWKVAGDDRRHEIQVNDRGTELRISLKAFKAPVLHGQNGLSQKGAGEGRASYYYSLTRMGTEGELTLNGKREKVHGWSWMDHEFGSNALRDDQVGWDWFSIQLDNQTELMLYSIRRKDGSVDPYSSGTLVSADGSAKHLRLDEFRVDVLEHWKSAESGAKYPIKWRVVIPGEQIELEIIPVFPEQELITKRSTRVTYWEGAVEIHGKAYGHVVNGNGYVEMTGYAGKLTL